MSVDSNHLKFTYEHYCCFPDDGNRHEIIDGDHFMNLAPSLNHQTILSRIGFQLYSQIELNELGWVFYAPVDVQLTPYDVVQPDLVLVLKDREKVLTESRIQGSPSLVIEILSPGTAQNDRTLKKQLYLKTGVPEYWIVDPKTKSIEQYVIEDDEYVLQPASETVVLNIIESVSIDTKLVWK